MNTQHTPGPWLMVADLERGTFRVGRQDQRFGQSIIRVCTVTDQGNDEEKTANARLIAAAPDLLAACEAMVELFAQLHTGNRYEADRQARAAIAKATQL